MHVPSFTLEDEDVVDDESVDDELESVEELPLVVLPDESDDVVPDEEDVPDCVVVDPLPAAPDEAPVAMVEATEVPAPEGLRMRMAATPRAVARAVMPPVRRGAW